MAFVNKLIKYRNEKNISVLFLSLVSFYQIVFACFYLIELFIAMMLSNVKDHRCNVMVSHLINCYFGITSRCYSFPMVWHAIHHCSTC